MRIIILLLSFWGVVSLGWTQNTNPITTYTELPNPVKTNMAQWKAVSGIHASWGTPDIRYKKEEPPHFIKKDNALTAWRGEKVASQLLVWGNKALTNLSIECSDLIHANKKSRLNKDCIFHGFVRYVMTDGLNKDGKGGCGARPDASIFDSTLVADPIDHLTQTLNVPAYTTQGVWLSINVPSNAEPGIYEGKVFVKNNEQTVKSLPLRLNVQRRALPPSEDWAFHLDLWQNPFAIARYHNVELWSEEHFKVMEPYMKLYKEAGGKVITASIIHKPWNGQTYDYFETMITWMKKADGSWYFDYTVFDKWVEFMKRMGIRGQINCYSMIPWKLSFQYFDQASNSLKYLNMEPGSSLYEEVWGTMLKSFAAHLKQKGWFNQTCISMDERPLDVMQKTIHTIKKAEPDFKISLAGAWHKELSDSLYDYCVALRMKYPEEIKKKRKANGQVTTYYTSCEEPYPNTFTFSPPAESEWFGWYAAKENLDGYLRWALNSWVKDPLRDSRFYTWAAGDTYMLYPGGRTSMRFEHLIAGIQAYEKIRILKKEFANNRKVLKKLQQILNTFDESKLDKEPASLVISKAKKYINGL